jgi:hypothetical protein
MLKKIYSKMKLKTEMIALTFLFSSHGSVKCEKRSLQNALIDDVGIYFSSCYHVSVAFHIK